MAEGVRKNCSKCGGEISDCVWYGIELESCQNCGGFFLDPSRILNAAVLAQSDAEDEKRGDRSALDSAPMTCPKCQRPMAKRTYHRKGWVVLDVCPSCHGVWFDAGEYAKYSGLNAKKASKKETYEVHLFCETCNAVIKKPKKEQNVCARCGERLSLCFEMIFSPAFFHGKRLYATISFIVGLGIVYLVAFKIFGNAFQAAVVSLAVCPIPLITVIRAFIYSKILIRGRDIDL